MDPNVKIFSCWQCGHKLRYPIKDRVIKFKCPECAHQYFSIDGIIKETLEKLPRTEPLEPSEPPPSEKSDQKEPVRKEPVQIARPVRSYSRLWRVGYGVLFVTLVLIAPIAVVYNQTLASQDRHNVTLNNVFRQNNPLNEAKVPIDIDQSLLFSNPPLVKEGKVYLSSYSGELVKFDLTSSSTTWMTNLKSPSTGRMIFDDKYLVVTTSEDGLLFVHASNGNVAYNYEHCGGVLSSPVKFRETVFVACNGNILRFKKGLPLDTIPTALINIKSLLIHRNRMLIVSEEGSIECKDMADNYSLDWKYSIGQKINLDPVLYKGNLLYATKNGLVYCLSRSGNNRLVIDLSGKQLSSMLISDHTLIVSTAKGAIYFVDPGSGKQIMRRLEFNCQILSDMCVVNDTLYIPCFDKGIKILYQPYRHRRTKKFNLKNAQITSGISYHDEQLFYTTSNGQIHKIK
ncbi:MAG: PQQ-binding-like beta-propeller repeat protein [Reichenbachiella sp.]|uniref:outer membrane protein assembly factor BamB family protein n=1 Tax=Reichenbachiella sp. TaxID=2184521 RepID=UPI0032630066